MRKKRKYIIENTCVGMYLSDVHNEKIRIDQAVQRAFCSNNEFINNLVYSVVSNEIYIPNIILADENEDDKIIKSYVVDAGQRTVALGKFMYEGYRITKTIREPMVVYDKRKTDENGDVVRDDNGEIIWEEVEYDLRGKTYDDLPDELKESFYKCPLGLTIYQNTKPSETTDLVGIYNIQSGMNVSQKSLTYLGNFAEEVKRIKDESDFLKDGTALTESDKKKGIWERVISECVMAVNHFENWKKDPKKMCDYLNTNATKNEYLKIEDYFNRLVLYSDKLENKKVSDLFTTKDILVWMKVFDNFTKLHISDDKFGEFLNVFVKGMMNKEVDGITWNELDADKHTKDTGIIQKKVEHLTYLLLDYLHIDTGDYTVEKNDVMETESNDVVTDKEENINVEEEDTVDNDILGFLKENISQDITEEDLKAYEEDLDVYSLDVDNNTLLLDKENRKSLLAMVAYSYQDDVSLDDWFVDFFKRNDSYLFDQKQNYESMKKDFEEFTQKGKNVA